MSTSPPIAPGAIAADRNGPPGQPCLRAGKPFASQGGESRPSGWENFCLPGFAIPNCAACSPLYLAVSTGVEKHLFPVQVTPEVDENVFFPCFFVPNPRHIKAIFIFNGKPP